MAYPPRQAQQQQESDDIKIGLWPKEGRSGNTYYAGQDEENWYKLFPKNSDNPNAPEFDLKITPKTEEERNWKPDQQRGGGQQRGQGGQQRSYGGQQRSGGGGRSYGGQQRSGGGRSYGGQQRGGYPPQQQGGGRGNGGRPPVDEGQYGGVGPSDADAPWDV